MVFYRIDCRQHGQLLEKILDLDPVSRWTLVVLVNADPPMAINVARKINARLKRLK